MKKGTVSNNAIHGYRYPVMHVSHVSFWNKTEH